MTIAEVRDKCKGVLGKMPRDMLIIGVLLGASSLAFALGYEAGREALPSVGGGEVAATETATSGPLVASKVGSKYYLTSCAAAEKISRANRIYFQTREAAKQAGYTPAANCPGL